MTAAIVLGLILGLGGLLLRLPPLASDRVRSG
jgi:hypothetical protein